MNKTPFFSVIMPVYGVENTLEAAVNSVLQQSFSNFELILVDDCSPDKSGEICDKLKEKDDRIKVIHKPKNEGPGYARNTGIETSQGVYLSFMDSDDIIEKETLQILYGYICESNADIYAFGLVQDYVDKNGVVQKSDDLGLKPCVANTLKDIAQLAIELDIQRNYAYACSKIYKADFIKKNGFAFGELRITEDFVFNIAVFPKAEKVVVVDYILYHYIKPPHTTLGSTYNAKFYEICCMRYDKEYELLKNCGIEDEKYLQAIKNIHIKHLLSVFVKDLSPAAKLNNKQRKLHIKEILNDAKTVKILKDSHSASKAIKVLEFVFKHKMVTLSAVLAKVYFQIQKSRNK